MCNFRRTIAAAALTGAVTLTGLVGVASAQQALPPPDLRRPAPAPEVDTSQDLRNADRRAPVDAPASESAGVSLPPGTTEDAAAAQLATKGPGELAKLGLDGREGRAFDWGDAAIGAAGGLAIAILAGTLAVSRPGFDGDRFIWFP
jgi:hypothetical protein